MIKESQIFMIFQVILGIIFLICGYPKDYHISSGLYGCLGGLIIMLGVMVIYFLCMEYKQ